jgi:hypothetical protein
LVKGKEGRRFKADGRRKDEGVPFAASLDKSSGYLILGRSDFKIEISVPNADRV